MTYESGGAQCALPPLTMAGQVAVEKDKPKLVTSGGGNPVLTLTDPIGDDVVLQVEDRRAQFKWRRIESAVDSGSVDIVANPRDFHGCEVQETEESRNEEHWVGAGGQRIDKLGEMQVEWFTDDMKKKRTRVKAGKVGRMLWSVGKLNEAGFDVFLTKRNPRIVNTKTGEVTHLIRKGGMFVMNMWVRVPIANSSEAPFQRPGK